jgi:iron complex outermembrane recepter protein
MRSSVFARRAAIRRQFLATTMLTALGTAVCPPAFAQTGDQPSAEGGGATPLPEVEVEANQQGPGGAGSTGCGEYGGAPCSGFGGAGLAQDPFNTSYVLPDASVGTKTDTPVMDTPLNVQSLSQQVIQDQQAINVDQALNNFSGVFVTSGTVGGLGTPGARFNILGFQAQTYYRDGIRVYLQPLQSDNFSSTQLADIASIEVLKGPGAILYGLSEPGGVINLVTKQPLNVPYYSVQQQIGSFDNYRTSIDATGPLSEDGTLLYRMNMSFQSNGGYFGSEVDFLREQNVFLAPVVKWNIDGSMLSKKGLRNGLNDDSC